MKRLIGVGVAVFVLVVGVASGLDRVAFDAPLLSPDTPQTRERLGLIVEAATDLLGRLHGEVIEVVENGEGPGPEYSVDVIAALEQESTALVVSLTRMSDGTKTAPVSWVYPLAPDTPLWLARVVYLLWTGLEGSYEATQPGPAYVDDLPAIALDPYLVPLGIAVTPSGTVAVALGWRCLEIDGAFRVVSEPGKVLTDRGNLTFAGSVASTPGGTLLLKSSTGRDLYRLLGDGLEPQRIPSGLDLSTVFYWVGLSDGSAVLVDAMNRKAFRVIPGQRRREIPLFAGTSSWPTAYAAGPESTLWVFDPILRGLRIHTADGTPVDILLPAVDPSVILSPVAMAVGPDGSFLVLSSRKLYKFRRDGTPVWTLDAIVRDEEEPLPTYASLAVDWTRGTIYLADPSARRITKLLDREVTAEGVPRDELDETILAARAGADPGSVAVLQAIAEVYDRAGSLGMARSYWQLVEEADPANPAASRRLEAIEIDELEVAARVLDRKARDTLATVGVETARPLSIQAIQKYEQLLARAPGRQETRQAMQSLQELFSGPPVRVVRPKPLTVVDIRMPPLFPSLMLWYATHPAGSVTVKNGLDEAVEDVRVSMRIPRFMDLAVETRLPGRLEPGQAISIPLSPSFDQRVLDLQEDLIVPAQVTITHGAGGPDREATRTLAVTIYRNTALTWDDTRKMSSFITPNDEVVGGFAARVVSGTLPPPDRPLSPRIFQAMRVLEAMGTYGIAYVPDPDSPISRTLGRAETVDTVRFPRRTLQNRTGDCDDTTALACSLLESVGIRTAIATTPGHIFMAFDTGEPAQNAVYLAGPGLEVLARDGSAWIPVETTILDQGFMTAWRTASELIGRHAATGDFELTRVGEMRETYPALPLEPSAVAVPDASRSAVEVAYRSTVDAFEREVYRDGVGELAAAIAREPARGGLKLRVREGVLHALFGRWVEAESVFRAVLSVDPGLVSAYVNLANVHLLTRDEEGALDVVREGLARNGESPLLNLLAARIYADRGDTEQTAYYYARVQLNAPELAGQYAHLGPAGGAASEGRAADAGALVPLWDGGE